MAYFVLRPLAQADMAETYSFMAQTSQGQAERWLEKIEAQCQQLAEMPEMGRLRPELPGTPRSFSVGRYIIFYRPINDGVEVVRVLHGSRDLGSIDFPE